MAKVNKSIVLADEAIISRIFVISGQRVIIDRDLAQLYGVETKQLKRQVRRNLSRFPADFMFQMSKKEFENWRSQFGTSNSADKMGLRYPPFCFTEQGVAMLSSVLRSPEAVAVNIQIMRTFVRLRGILAEHEDLKRQLATIERKYDGHFKAVFDAIREIMTPPEPPKKRRIGFIQE